MYSSTYAVLTGALAAELDPDALRGDRRGGVPCFLRERLPRVPAVPGGQRGKRSELQKDVLFSETFAISLHCTL